MISPCPCKINFSISANNMRNYLHCGLIYENISARARVCVGALNACGIALQQFLFESRNDHFFRLPPAAPAARDRYFSRRKISRRRTRTALLSSGFMMKKHPRRSSYRVLIRGHPARTIDMRLSIRVCPSLRATTTKNPDRNKEMTGAPLFLTYVRNLS